MTLLYQLSRDNCPVYSSSDSEVGSSSDDEVYPSYSYAACYKDPYHITNHNNTTSSPDSVFHEGLSIDEETSDPQLSDLLDDLISDDETGCYADNNHAGEDYATSVHDDCSDGFNADESYTNDAEDDMLDGHKRRLTSRNLRQLRRHPYARTGAAIDPKVALFQPDCPRNGRRLCAPPRWQRQATSIRSNSFITSDALIAIIASARLDSTSSSLDARLWVTNAVSYLKTPDRVELAGGSIEQTIARCHSISIQTTGSSLVAMITYMQLAIQCQRYCTHCTFSC